MKQVNKLFIYWRLTWQLAHRDLKVQYSQSVIGILWALIQPLTGLILYTFLFDTVINTLSDTTVPYPLFVFSGVIHWMLFSAIVARAGTALSANINILKNWNFPRLILPASKSVVCLVEFAISLPILIGILWYYGFPLRWQMMIGPLFLAMNIICALSIALWLSALTVRYRDFHHIIPYLVGFGIFVTPVFFPSTLIPEDYAFLTFFNPMSCVIEGFRWCLHGGSFDFIGYTPSVIITLLLSVSGLLFFKRQELNIVDFI